MLNDKKLTPETECDCENTVKRQLRGYTWNESRKELYSKFLKTDVIETMCHEISNTEMVFVHGTYVHPDIEKPKDIDLIVVTKEDPHPERSPRDWVYWMVGVQHRLGEPPADVTLLDSTNPDYQEKMKEYVDQSKEKHGLNLMKEIWVSTATPNTRRIE